MHTEPYKLYYKDKVHLSDEWRVIMGMAVIKQFQGETEGFVVLG